jgi:ATP sulfurylase
MPIHKTEILCTLGPASFNEQVIKRLDDLGVGLFRINLSHTKARDLLAIIENIQAHTDVPICLDTEGAQIRTGDFVENQIELRENSIIRGYRRKVPGDSTGFNFYPDNIVGDFQVGDFISIDFNSVLVQVIGMDEDGASLRVINGGSVGRNKAVTVDRDIAMNPLTENDLACLAIGMEKGLTHYALSFASCREDVQEIFRLTSDDAFIISKIESLSGLANLNDIAEASTALLIDRGDLSRQVPLERIPEVQKAIIRTAKAMNRKVYVATNLLESMITLPTPTRAEVNDIYNTLLDGADGLVLAAETAIGSHPIACASMVSKMIQNFEKPEQADPLEYPFDPISLLVEPHGGHLVQRHASSEEREQARHLPRLSVSDTTLLDCEQITHGTYSPLTGFMDRQTCEAVLETNCLPDGTVWTMPILLAARKQATQDFGAGDKIALAGADKTIYATLNVTEIFTMDLEQVARKWFGTVSKDHPGVARLFRGGDQFIAGDVSLVERLPSPYRHYELTPAQSRFIFAHKGWSKVVGFHTRNPIHRGHEHIQLQALQQTGADGLYINPVIGPKKPGDFLPGPIMQSYQTMLEFGLFPKGKVILGSFATYSRYAGPREAVFTALCRKNMGCSYFIIGRDHTGVGDFYAPGANQAYMEKLGDFGIQPVFFDAVGYDAKSDRHGFASEGEDMTPIDGTQVRDALRDGTSIPNWVMRDIIQETLRAEVAQNRPLFVE